MNIPCSTIYHIITSSSFDTDSARVERYGIPTEHRVWVSQPTSLSQAHTDLDPTYDSSVHSTSTSPETGTDIIPSIPTVSMYEYLALSHLLMYSLNIGHWLTIAKMSIYNYVTLPPFYPQILNFSALKSKLFEVSKTKELPEAKLSVASVPVGNYRIQLNVHSRKVPIHKLSQIGKNHSDDGSYPWSIRLGDEAQEQLMWLFSIVTHRHTTNIL